MVGRRASIHWRWTDPRGAERGVSSNARRGGGSSVLRGGRVEVQRRLDPNDRRELQLASLLQVNVSVNSKMHMQIQTQMQCICMYCIKRGIDVHRNLLRILRGLLRKLNLTQLFITGLRCSIFERTASCNKRSRLCNKIRLILLRILQTAAAV